MLVQVWKLDEVLGLENSQLIEKSRYIAELRSIYSLTSDVGGEQTCVFTLLSSAEQGCYWLSAMFSLNLTFQLMK